MTTKVLLMSGVLLLLLLATFAAVTDTQNEDLVFDSDIETLIERHRQNSLSHRIKRTIWVFIGKDDMEESSNSTLETSAEPDYQETEQDLEPFPLIDRNDTNDQQTNYTYVPENSEGQTSSREQKPRQSGEDLDGNEYANTAGDHEYHEDYDGSGQIDHERSTAEPDIDTPHISSFQEGPFDAEEPISIQGSGLEKGPGPEPGPDAPSYFYRVTTIISEPYKEGLADCSSPQFKELGDQLSQAIDALYKRDLPNHRTRAKILKFLQTSDPVATQVSLDIQSTSPAEEKIRSIFADQLQLHTLGDIQARPDGFSFRNMQDLSGRECNLESEFACQSDGECLPISARCDGIPQCIDESDEANCTPPETTTIAEATTEFWSQKITVPVVDEVQCLGDQTIRCNDGSRCFGSIQRCDQVQDCDDNSDEENCPHEACLIGEFACDVSRCISNDQRCDFIPQCDDQSDELECPTPPACPVGKWPCSNGVCIDEKFRCDGIFEDCLDRSDEAFCDFTTPRPICLSDEFECSDGECIPGSARCDGDSDCRDAGDELNCTRGQEGLDLKTHPNDSTIKENARPEIPRAVIKPRFLSVEEGNPVEFRCDATGNPPPQLSWIRVQGEINPAASFENGIWRLPSARKSDEAVYACLSRNGAGTNVIRTILYVTVNSVPTTTPPSPIIDPAEWIGGPTDTIRLVCTAPRGARITWTRSENVSLPVSATEQNGILTIYNPSPSDAGYYICTAITYEGVETRSTARVTIQFQSARPPNVRIEPEWREAFQGTLTEVNCIVTGDPTPVVTWTKYDEPLASHIQIVGNTLRIIDPQVSDRGVYVCHATNSGGSAQSSAVIDVNRRDMPVLELYPQQKQVVRINGSAILQCRVTKGIPTPSVSWAREDGRPFSSNVQQLAGALLRFDHVTPEDGGSFRCSASNEVGSVFLVAIVEISTPPEITISPSNNKPLKVKRGDKVRLTCTASGHPNPSVEWKKNTHSLSGVTIFPRLQSSMAIYEISSVSYNDGGSYTCVATNAYGPVSDRIQIRVEDDEAGPNTSIFDPKLNGSSPGVTTPEERLRIPDGGNVEMPCQVHGNDQVAIYLDWKRNDGRNLPQRSTVRGGILLIPAVTKDDAGEYLCQGLNTNGNVLSTAATYLEVIYPPRIELDPIQQVVRPGDSPSLMCRVTGDQPIEIEWYAIDRPLPYTVTQAGGFLQFNGITSANAGKYVCKATNNAGTAEAVAQVLINDYNQPSISANQRNINTFVGYSVRLECPADSRSTITWSRDRGDLPRNSNRRGNILELTEVKSEDSGRYICRITTQNGASSTVYIDLRVELYGVLCSSTEFQCHSGVCIDRLYLCDGYLDCTDGSDEQYCFDRYYHQYPQRKRGGNNDAPAVETKLAPYGTGVVMDCTANIEPPIRFQWHKLSGRLPVNSRTSDNHLELLEVKAEDAGTYICQANNGRVNIKMPQVLVVTGVVPYFNQAPTSYISFPPIPDASLQFQIEVSFKPENYDGIILYNGPYGDGTGDFILLSLVGGYAEFRFNLGSSPAVIRGNRPITLGVWHTIKLHRDHKHGTMFVDGEGPYSEIARGRFQTLDLSEPLYIGGVPDYNAISQQVNVNSGFVGCISKVVIGNTQLDLTGDHLVSIGITTCETCAENPCSNNGVCQEAATENGYTCLCPAGYSGKNCTNIGQACSPDICGEGTCVDRDEGFVCSCPVGKGGSRCEFDVHVIEPAFRDRGAYLANQTLEVHRTSAFIFAW